MLKCNKYNFFSRKDTIMEEITYLTDEQIAKKKKRAKIFDKVTTGILIFLLTTPVLILGYIFLWFALR